MRKLIVDKNIHIVTLVLCLIQLSGRKCCNLNSLTQPLCMDHQQLRLCSSRSKWLDCESRLSLHQRIDATRQKLMNEEIHHWKCALERLMMITMYLAQHNLPFRGSSDKLFTKDNGHFLDLVDLFGNFDNVMREHLRRVLRKDINYHYCGKIIQGELIRATITITSRSKSISKDSELLLHRRVRDSRIFYLKLLKKTT